MSCPECIRLLERWRVTQHGTVLRVTTDAHLAEHSKDYEPVPVKSDPETLARAHEAVDEDARQMTQRLMGSEPACKTCGGSGKVEPTHLRHNHSAGSEFCPRCEDWPCPACTKEGE